jgi:hypothetical protein
MKRTLIFVGICSCLTLLSSGALAASQVATVRHVDVLSSGNRLEIEITTSEPVKPQTQVITGPDRLVVDLPGALPDSKLHDLTVNRGDVKTVRVGIFAQNPPTTRIVFDLKSAPQYQIFPSGRTLIVKLGEALAAGMDTGAASQPPSSGVADLNGIGTVTGGTVRPLSVPRAPAVAASAPDVKVEFRNGKLSIWADKATLASVLYEVQRRTGAEVSFPPAASQEKIVADIAAAPPRDALASLLDGSQFDFILMGSDRDPQSLRSIVLTPRGAGSGSEQAFFPATQSSPDSGTNPAGAQPDAQPDTSSDPPPDVQSTPEPQPDMVPQPQPENSQP